MGVLLLMACLLAAVWFGGWPLVLGVLVAVAKASEGGAAQEAVLAGAGVWFAFGLLRALARD